MGSMHCIPEIYQGTYQSIAQVSLTDIIIHIYVYISELFVYKEYTLL